MCGVGGGGEGSMRDAYSCSVKGGEVEVDGSEGKGREKGGVGRRLGSRRFLCRLREGISG